MTNPKKSQKKRKFTESQRQQFSRSSSFAAEEMIQQDDLRKQEQSRGEKERGRSKEPITQIHSLHSLVARE